GNCPNPFNNSTDIIFYLNHPGPIQLSVVNQKGQLVYTESVPFLQAGRNAITWNPAGLSSGIYLIRLEHGGQVQTRKGVLMK
ncbi:MAG: T9SS type A sorting domain-containing protein, partial [Anaerolineae bacterium]|nr:T9SS type A sorting domain-containing protein [Anaerolineae bacterium]